MLYGFFIILQFERFSAFGFFEEWNLRFFHLRNIYEQLKELLHFNIHSNKLIPLGFLPELKVPLLIRNEGLIMLPPT